MSFKRFFLLSPLLWLRKLIVYLLVFVVILGIVIYFIANSPWVIKKAAERFAPEYHISYSRIHGNVLTGVEIEDLAYENKPLSKHFLFKWNPNALIKKEILVNHFVLEKVNVDTLKRLIAAFSTEDKSSSEPFTFSVKVKKLAVDVDPFVAYDTGIKHIILDAKNVYYKGEDIQIGELGLLLDTNITKLTLKASLNKGAVDVKELVLQDVDTLALQRLVLSDENSSIKEGGSEDTSVAKPLMPKMIHLHRFHANILEREYAPVAIHTLDVALKEAVFDVAKGMLEKAHLSMVADTNLANIEHEGDIVNNHLLSTVTLMPKEALFTHYNLPLREAAFKAIEVQVDANKERVIAALDTQILQVLKAKKDALNVDVNRLKSTLSYRIEEGTLKAESKAQISTPYAKDIELNNLFTLDDNISYRGDMVIKQITGIDAKFVKPLNDLHIVYEGDEKSINTNIYSKMLKGSFNSSDFKTALLHLESKEDFMLRDFLALPKELNATKASLRIDAPLHFDANASTMAYAQIHSNVANIDANISYKKNLHLASSIDVPKASLLRPYVKSLQWDNIMPIKVNADVLEKSIEAKVDAGVLGARASYELNSTAIRGDIVMEGLETKVSGIVPKKLHIISSTQDMSALMQSISMVYTLDALPKIDGSAKLTVDINDLKKIDVALRSPSLVYHADHKTSTQINNIDVLMHYEEGTVVLEHYSVLYDKEKIYATKPSTITLNDDNIIVKPLWLNDALKAEGYYSLKTKQGKILLGADKLHIAHEMIDLDSKIDIVTELDANKTKVQGKIILLGGNIHYDISQKSFASDSDIIIVQDIKKENESAFMDGLSVELQIKTKKPLVYNAEGIHLKADVDVSLYKAENSDLLVLGSLDLIKGSTYVFQDKTFVLDKSAVYFTGNPNKPLLDVKVNYKAVDYFITVKITGLADLPNITFSSKPSLSREEILSLILFDSVEAAGTNSGDKMMRMMGGAMAKSALNDLGVKIDHLVLGEGNSVEVGKKLTDKITIIYVNGDVAEVKLKYEHSKYTESIIGASERSQSYDIIYKRDF